jgi:hypothetical protein
MQSRRDVLGTVAGVGCVGLAGCSLLTGPIEQSAAPAGLRDEVRESAGFDHNRTEELQFEQTVEVGGESRDLRLTNYVVEYGKQIASAGPQGTQFVLFSTPSVTVADREANPFANFDDRQLLGEIIGRSEQGATSIDATTTQTLSVLGTETQFRIYQAVTTVEGQDIPIQLYFGRTKHDGDLLGLLGVYPQILDEGETIAELVEGTYHPAEFDSDSQS